jgi:hypothetical protein
VANLKLNASEKVNNGMAWASFIFAVLGGLTATGTFAGKFVGKIVHGLPIWIILPVALAVLWFIFSDLKDDGVPDRLRTIYMTIFWPSWLLGAQGKLAKYVNGWIYHMNGWIDKKVGPWISDHPSHTGTHALMTALSLTFIVLAVLQAHRYYSKNKGAGTTTAVTAGGGTPVIANRKRR